MLRYIIIGFFSFFIVCSSNAQTDSKAIEWTNHQIGELQGYVDRAHTIFNNVQNNQSFQDILNGKDITLPAKILPSSKDDKYALYLDSLIFTPEYAYATIYFVLDLSFDSPENKKLTFIGKDIRFSRKGGFTGNATLQLAESIDVNFGEDATVTFLAEEAYPTYVVFDCNGFKEISLSANIGFSSDFAYPVDQNNERLEGQKLETKFNLTIEKWEDWIAQIEIQKFQLVKLPDFTFDFGVIAYDHSDLKNPSKLGAFPDSYDIQRMYEGNPVLWRGLYIEQAGVTMPRMFYKKENPRAQMAINGYNMFFDKQGFTGKVEVVDLIKKGEGEMNTWDYSVDTLYAEFSQGTLVEAGLNGSVVLPISSENAALGYAASISYNPVQKAAEYNFTANLESKIDFNVFKVADVELYDGSRLDVQVINKKFKPTAVLNGTFGLTPDLGGKASSFLIEYNRLKLATEKPYVSFEQGGGAALVKNEKSTMKGFPVELTRLGVISDEKDEDRIGLDIGVKLNLMKATEGTGMTAEAGLIVWGKRDNTVLRYKYDDLYLTDMAIEYRTTALYIYGRAQFYRNDSIYGNGVGAQLKAEVADKIKIAAIAKFGTAESKEDPTDEYRYWIVEMGVGFSPAIPFFPGIGLNGFSGGAYHHMMFDSARQDYIPNEIISLGLKAGVGVQSIPSNKAFAGKVQLELAFDTKFRFNFFRFSGEVAFINTNSNVPDVTQLDGLANNPSESNESGSAVIVGWDISYSVPKKTLFGTIDTYIAVPPGPSPIVSGLYNEPGQKHDNLAGTVSLYFSSSDWYVYVGQPVVPLGINLKIAGLQLGTLETYFVMGTRLPSPPMAPVPDQVKKIVGAENTFDPTLLTSGAGVGLGTRFSAGLSIASPRILGVSGYVNAEFGAGFDLLFMKASGPGFCKGRDEIGINNWYAYGQIYIYASAKVGVDVRWKIGFLSINKKFDLLGLDLAAYMYFQGPNPLYAMGAVGAKVEVLGGLIDAEFKFKVEFGDKECGKARTGDALDIFDYSFPREGEENVDPYQTPTVYMAVPIKKEFSTADKEGKMQDIRIVIDTLKDVKLICNNCSNKNIEVNYAFGDQDNLVIKPIDVLPGNKTFTFTVTARAQKKSTGDSWGSYDGIPAQTYTVTFTTKAERITIPISNIQYSYPLPNMKNFYVDESNEGYIKTVVKPSLPLKKMDGYSYMVKYVEGDEVVFSSKQVTVTDSRAEAQFKFPIPSDQLKPSTNYKFVIVQTKDDQTSGSQNNKEDLSYGTTDDLNLAKDSVIVSYSFQTSKYKTFADKMASLSNAEVIVGTGGRITHTFNSTSESGESFYFAELAGYSPNGGNKTEPLIQVRYKPLNASLIQTARGSIYKNTSLFTERYQSKDYSLPPFDAFTLKGNTDLSVELDFMAAMQADHDYAKQVFESYNYTAPLPVLPAGTYGYFLDYYLPGKSIANSTVAMQYKLNQEVKIN